MRMRVSRIEQLCSVYLVLFLTIGLSVVLTGCSGEEVVPDTEGEDDESDTNEDDSEDEDDGDDDPESDSDADDDDSSDDDSADEEDEKEVLEEDSDDEDGEESESSDEKSDDEDDGERDESSQESESDGETGNGGDDNGVIDDVESEDNNESPDADDDANSDDDSEVSEDEGETCAFECMAEFQCERLGGDEVEGECDNMNSICCDAPEDTSEDDTADDDTEQSEDTEDNNEEDTEDDTGDTGVPLDDGGEDDGLFSIDVRLSESVSTVGIVTWSIDASIDSATIHFGREEGNYEFQAPGTDFTQGSDYRTLLLGMKPNATYYLQIAAEGGGSSYTSAVYSIDTGAQRTGLPNISMGSISGDSYEGFTIGCTGISMGMGGGGGGGQYAYIFDKDGDMVWWYDVSGTTGDVTRARMSYYGDYMWAGDNNVGGGGGKLMRVGMDGSDPKTFDLPGRHHDFANAPDNKIIVYERSSSSGGGGGGGMGMNDSADIVYLLDGDSGQTSEIYHQNTDFQSLIDQNGSHTNSINYVPHLDAFSFSMLNFNTIAVVSMSGQLLATYGGSQSDFSSMSWNRQHGHHVTEDGLVVFNNNGTNGGSSALVFDSSGQRVLDYASGVSSQTFGDARQLPNGNILVTYSNNGVIHEVSSGGTLIQETNTGSIGYSTRRKALYGPPPPWGE